MLFANACVRSLLDMSVSTCQHNYSILSQTMPCGVCLDLNFELASSTLEDTRTLKANTSSHKNLTTRLLKAAKLKSAAHRGCLKCDAIFKALTHFGVDVNDQSLVLMRLSTPRECVLLIPSESLTIQLYTPAGKQA